MMKTSPLKALRKLVSRWSAKVASDASSVRGVDSGTPGEPVDVRQHRNDDGRELETGKRPQQALVGTPAGNQDVHLESTLNDVRRFPRGLDVPDAIDHFEIRRVLGQGGFGSVFLAYDTRLDRMVALKLLDKLERGAARRMLDYETRAAAKLRHPNLVTVFQDGEHERGCYIVFEYVAGSECEHARTLRELLAGKKRVEPEKAVRFIRQISEALAYAHDLNVVHRDIKPENILIDFKEVAYLADFGCARQSKRHLECVHPLVGTLPYMSLEQIDGSANAQTDIWSVGVVLYEVLSGKRPFEFAEKTQSRSAAEAAFSYAVAVLDAKQLPPVEGVDADLLAICQKCLEPNIADRYQTAAEVAADLARWQRKEPVSCRPLGIAERGRRWAQRNPVIATQIVLIAVLLVVGFGVAAFLATNLWAARERYVAEKIGNVTGADLDTFAAAMADLQHDTFRESAVATLMQQWTTTADLPNGGAGSLRRNRLAAALVAFDRTDSGQKPPTGLVEEATEQLQQSMLTTKYPAEFRFCRHWLVSNAPQPSQRDRQRIAALWRISRQTTGEQRFRALVALSDYDPKSAHWDEQLESLATGILAQETSNVSQWSNSSTRLADRLLPLIEDEIESADPLRRRRAEIALASLATTPGQMIKRIIDASAPEVARELLLQLKSTPLDRAERRSVDAVLTSEHDGLSARQMAQLSLTWLFLDGPKVCGDLPIFNKNASIDALLIFERNAAPWGLPLRSILDWIDRLRVEPDTIEVLPTAVLALAYYEVNRLADTVRRPVIETVLALYRDHPHAGVHAATERVLRAWDVPLPTVASVSDQQPKAWRVNELGLLLVRARLPNGKTCEVSAYEITLGDYARYVRSRAEFYANDPRLLTSLRRPIINHFNFFPRDEGDETMYDEQNIPPEHLQLPIRTVSALQAVAYCVWVSQQTGITADQFCFTVGGQGSDSLLVAIERKIPGSNSQFRGPITGCDRNARGYRLPFQDEWRHLVDELPEDAALMNDIGWNQDNAQGRIWPVGRKRPNRLGIFDMAGNVAEWYLGQTDSSQDPVEADNIAGQGAGYVTFAAMGGDYDSALSIESRLVEAPQVFGGDERIGYRLIRVIE